MKKILTVFISLLLVAAVSACSTKKGSVSGISESDSKYVVTFENATKDMAVSTEMTLGENQVFSFDHQLQTDDGVKVEFKDADGVVVSDVDLNDVGGGQVYVAPGTYTVEVTVTSKANGTLSVTLEDLQNNANMENPWTMTADMQEALDATGVNFHSPVDNALPGDIRFTACYYTEDVFQANYENETNCLFFRVSKNHEGKEDLAGDFNEYEKTWQEPVKGLQVTCYGEDDSIRLATFSVGDQNYSISYNSYQNAPGMSVDELNSLLMGM